MLDKLLFLLKANTLHGTHSPFVYDLLENVAYSHQEFNCFLELHLPKKKFNIMEIKKNQFFFKLIEYYGLKNIFLTHNELLKMYLTASSKKFESISPAIETNFYYCDASQINCPLQDIQLKKEESFFVLDNLRSSKQSLQNWNNYFQNQENIIALDFYDFGIFIFRKTQRKEYFNLRFKY